MAFCWFLESRLAGTDLCADCGRVLRGMATVPRHKTSLSKPQHAHVALTSPLHRHLVNFTRLVLGKTVRDDGPVPPRVPEGMSTLTFHGYSSPFVAFCAYTRRSVPTTRPNPRNLTQ